MKPERKKELQTNSLYSWLHQFYDEGFDPLVQKLPITPQLRMPLSLTFLVVFVFGGVWYVTKGLNDSRNAAAWQELFQVAVPPSPELVTNEENYERLNDFILAQEAAQNSLLSMVPFLSDNSHVIAWAKVKAANLSLAIGINDAYANKKAADKVLKTACENYEAARNLVDAALAEELHRQAVYGLARAHETQMGTNYRNRDKNRDEAQRYYEELAKLDPDGALGAFAMQRSEYLRRDKTDAGFYGYLANYEPETTPEDGSLPSSALPLNPGALENAVNRIELAPGTDAAPAPAATDAAPAPGSTEAAPTPAATDAAPTPESTEAAPTPESTEAAPTPESTEAKPASADDKDP